jgi:hypothetical protein
MKTEGVESVVHVRFAFALTPRGWIAGIKAAASVVWFEQAEMRERTKGPKGGEGRRKGVES